MAVAFVEDREAIRIDTTRPIAVYTVYRTPSCSSRVNTLISQYISHAHWFRCRVGYLRCVYSRIIDTVNAWYRRSDEAKLRRDSKKRIVKNASNGVGCIDHSLYVQSVQQ